VSETAQEPLASVPDPPPAEPEPKAAKQDTAYLVLSKDADKDWWIAAGTYNAASSKAAVSAHVKAKGSTVGTFVAVPERSWHPLTLKVETQPKITLT
jgi:hypothetical protein